MQVIYVDDEMPALENFRYTAAKIKQIGSLQLFSRGVDAIEYVKSHTVDVAFLDMEMPGIHGLGLALRLRELSPNLRVVFVTAYSQYALDAWKVNANGYVMKPYSVSDIQNELEKCVLRPLPSQKIVINTIPGLSITVDGKIVHISGDKTRELLALLVDQADRGITVREGISYLWPERYEDNSTKSLFRMTYKRLADALSAEGIGHILISSDKRRYLRTEEVDCDLYRILSGDDQAAALYNGLYLQEYEWAEERNGQLYRMLMQ